MKATQLHTLILIMLVLSITTYSQDGGNTEKDYGEMIFVKGGTFQMGSNDGRDNEKPVHSITLDDFYIDKYEVTVREFKKFIDATGHKTYAEENGYGFIWNGGKFEAVEGVFFGSTELQVKCALKASTIILYCT